MKTASYHPDRLEIEWATPYQQAHEWAHVEQHARCTLAWRLRARWCGTPFVERVANLAVEWQAARMAKREMEACGIWTEDDAREAFAGLLSYALSLLSEKLREIILPSLFESQTAHSATRTT